MDGTKASTTRFARLEAEQTDNPPMDRLRVAESPWSVRRLAWVAVACLVILAAIVADRFWLRAPDGIDLAEFVIADVRRGSLLIEVQGAGVLEPVSERWMTAVIQGTVEEVLARPGARVARGDSIVRFANPQIRRELAQTRLALSEVEAENRRLAADVTERRLAAEARLLDANANQAEQELRLEAQAQLREQNAVSEIDYRSQQIRTDQAKVHAEFERRRLKELNAALEAERQASEARVSARRAALEEAERELASLDLTAVVPGTLRELLVEPGEFVTAGAQVARLADTSSLIAAVRIPEFYASHLAPDQHALATVLNSDMRGTVIRVDPAVTQGTVTVDLDLAGPLPTGARPDLSVRATITVGELQDVLYVRRPLHVRDHSTADVFVLGKEGGLATRTTARFGMGTLKHVEVAQGLREGDTLLLGNQTRLDGLDVVAVR